MIVHQATPSHDCGLLRAAFDASRNSLQLSQGLASEPEIMQPCSKHATNVCGNVSLWDCTPSTPQPRLWDFAGRICCTAIHYIWVRGWPQNLETCSHAPHMLSISSVTCCCVIIHQAPPSHDCGTLRAAFVASRNSLQLSQGLACEPKIMQPCSSHARNVCGNIFTHGRS